MMSRLRSNAVDRSHSNRLPGVDGVRAIAALSVLIYHVWLYGPPGTAEQSGLGPFGRFMPDFAFGVILFFTLSGFLLYRPFAGALLREHDRPSFVRYLRNRSLRILPAYWVILFLVSFVLQAALVRDSTGELRTDALHDPALFLKNLLLVQNYSPGGVITGIGPAWSLAVEVVFYVTLPLLVLAAYALVRPAATRRGRRLAAFAPAAILLLAGLGGKTAAAHLVPGTGGGWNADWHSVLERSFLSQADLFAFGMALAVVHVDAEDGLVRFGRRSCWLAAAVAIGAYLVTAKMTSLGQLGHSPYNTLMAFAAALLLALVVVPRSGRRVVAGALDSRPLVWIGLVSYSLFLWHEPLVRFLDEHGLTFGGDAGMFANLGLVGAVALALSSLTYRLVEKPALRRKQRTVSAGRAVPAPATE
jgi:peptidoglycan/LPS O-acetylase OafA/YrhL